MFTGGSSSGGNLERQNPARGAAHPYLDSVPASTGPPLFPPYNSRDRVEDDNRAGDNAAADGDAAGNSFNEEDRMLLRLLYHQQQAIQVQLNTMTEWMQQVNYRITNVERALRASRSTLPTTAAPPSSGAPRSYPAQPQSRSASAMEGYAPMSSPHLASQPRPMAQATAEVTHAPPSAPGSTYSGQSPQLSSALAVSSVLEGSRACTPPSAQTRHQMGGAVGSSAVPSTTRSYESALAAPWDPHNASQQSLGGGGGAVHSRTSSHTSALGRRANPLLNSSASKGKVQAPGAASRSSLMDSRQQLSRLDTSGLSGTGQTSSMGVSGVVPDAVSASGQPRQPPMVSPPTSSTVPYADAVVPPYRRIPTEPTTLPRQPLSRLAAASRHAPPSGTLADLAEERAGREGTLPPPPRSAATSSLQDNDESHRDGNRHALQQPPSTTEQSSKESARATASAFPAAASTSMHADPAGSGGGESSLRPRKGGVHRVAADDDSLSDGYGSYESRMYMKNLGLL